MVGLSWFSGSDAPFIPTTDPNLKKTLKAAGIKKGKVFYELGSGDGRVVLEAASLGAKAIGIEQSWLRVIWSRWKAIRLGLREAHFYHGNIFDRNYFPADVVFIYLLTPAVLRLEKKLKKELRQGTFVITQTYHFKNWPPVQKIGSFHIYRA